MSLLPQYHCGTRDKNDNEEHHYQNSLKDNIKCSKIHKKLKSNGEGKIVIEVPHARDLLLDQFDLKSLELMDVGSSESANDDSEED